MNTIKRAFQIVILILMPVLLCSCFGVKVIKDVKNPDRYFRKAYDQIERIHKQDPDRERSAHSVHVLIYEGSAQKIISITAPLYIVDVCKDFDMFQTEDGDKLGFEAQFNLDWEGIEGLDKLGPGLLLEIDEEKNKILVWLE